MRIKLIALISGLLVLFGWAVVHQMPKTEALPLKLTVYALHEPALSIDARAHLEKQFQQDYTILFCQPTDAQSMFAAKVDTLLHGIKENWGGVFLLSELTEHNTLPDRAALLNALSRTDLIFTEKDDVQGACIACRANKRTLQLWQTIKHMIDEHPEISDQECINNVLSKHKIAKLRWDYLPKQNQTAGLA